MMIRWWFLAAALCIGTTLPAQKTGSWNGKQCAVVLTYDDALDVHIDNALPLLDSLGLKATFYLSGYSGALDRRMPGWRQAAKNGHELGNHTLFHPCIGGKPGREFVTADYDLGKYSFKRIQDEIRMTNTVLRAIDGNTQRTFAYPCGDTRINDSFYLAPLQKEFVAARGTSGIMHSKGEADRYNIGCITVMGHTGDQLVQMVQKAMAEKKMLVFLFHGVGGGHGLNVDLAAHRQLLQYLKAHEADIWIAPMVEVARFKDSVKEM